MRRCCCAAAGWRNYPRRIVKRRGDLVAGIVLGIVIGIAIIAVFVFVFSPDTIDAPSLDRGESSAAPADPGSR